MKKHQTKPTIIYFPAEIDKVLKSYFSLLRANRKNFWNKLDINLLKKIFLLSLNDFYQKKIDLNQLSAIAGRLYYNDRSWVPFDIDSQDAELGKILGYTEEISYRQYKYKKTNNTQDKIYYDSLLREIKEYFNKNKHLLEIPKMWFQFW